MSVTVVVGGQYGSEGKGKVTSYLSVRDNADIVVRCGGPNSGHTVDYQGRRHELRCLPAGLINPKSRLLLAAGCLISPEILLAEMKAADVDPQRLGVDPNAGVVLPADVDEEAKLRLRDTLGSTLSGTGVAVARRALRSGFTLARDVPELRHLLTDVSGEINYALDTGKRVIVEGTQGYGLSVYHSPHYPYATSRDTTASGFISEAGLSPCVVTDVIMCVRTYPIRVAGNSGPLESEISWDEVQRRSSYPTAPREYTTTTKRLRRVGLFDYRIVERAALVNRPTQLALHGADYLCFSNKSARSFEKLEPRARSFIAELETRLRVPATLIGTGPANEDLIDRTLQ